MGKWGVGLDEPVLYETAVLVCCWPACLQDHYVNATGRSWFLYEPDIKLPDKV